MPYQWLPAFGASLTPQERNRPTPSPTRLTQENLANLDSTQATLVKKPNRSNDSFRSSITLESNAGNSQKRWDAHLLEGIKQGVSASKIQTLLDNGASPNAVDEKVGYTALTLAIKLKRENIADILLAHPKLDINAAPIRDESPIFQVIISAKNHQNEQDIHWLNKILAHKSKPNVNQRNLVNNTAMILAAEKGRLDLMKILHAHGGDLRAVNNRGQLPIHFSVIQKDLKATEWILSQGLSLSDKDLPELGNLLTFAYMQKSTQKMIGLLLKHGADPNVIVNIPSQITELRSGGTVLMRATALADLATVRILLNHHADPNIPLSNGTTALSLVEARMHDPMLQSQLKLRIFYSQIHTLLKQHGAVKKPTVSTVLPAKELRTINSEAVDPRFLDSLKRLEARCDLKTNAGLERFKTYAKTLIKESVDSDSAQTFLNQYWLTPEILHAPTIQNLEAAKVTKKTEANRKKNALKKKKKWIDGLRQQILFAPVNKADRTAFIAQSLRPQKPEKSIDPYLSIPMKIRHNYGWRPNGQTFPLCSISDFEPGNDNRKPSLQTWPDKTFRSYVARD